jgi:PEP-CTERM motif
MMSLRIRTTGLAVMLLGLVVGQANAGLLPVSASVQPDADNLRYTYGVVLTSDSTLHTGDFFTVYDFAGFVDGSNVQPENFAFSAAMTGPTPGGITATDDPTKPNLTWTYTGADTLAGQVGLGNFSAISTNPESNTTTGFAGTTHREIDGLVDSNITLTAGPGDPAPPPPTAGVPEPASMALVGIGLPLVGFFYRRRRA